MRTHMEWLDFLNKKVVSWPDPQKLLKEGELLKYSRKEKQPRMFFLVSAEVTVSSLAPRAGSY